MSGSKRNAPKKVKGCYWRDGVYYGRIQRAGGKDLRWSLRTDDPKIAGERRKQGYNRLIGAVHYGEHRRTFAEALEAWGEFIPDNVSPKTLTRYTSSLAVLQPFLDGLYLDEFDQRATPKDPEAPCGTKIIAEMVDSRRNVPYVPRGKKKAIKVKIATVKRDLTALSSVFDYCIDQNWMATNPARDWLNPGHRRKSRLKERRDPIVLPEAAHIQMVVDRAPGLFAEMIRGAVKTGARLDELAKGQRQHFDRGRQQLTVIGKRNKLRVIALKDGGVDFGLEIFSRLPLTMECKALFWHRLPEGKRIEGQPSVQGYRQVSSNFRRIVAAVAKQAREQAQDFRPFRFHDLRHVHAVNWLKSGRSIYVLKDRLGHTSVKTTEMYLAFLTAAEKQRVMFAPIETGTKTGTRAAVKGSKKR